MKFSTQFKPINYQEDTVGLLNVLELGNSEIEEGRFRDAEDVFAELEKIDP